METLFPDLPPAAARRASAMGAHQSARPGTVTWLTPPEIIAALGGAESFALDPCTVQRPPWPTARRHVSLPEDGLAIEWSGRVWLNPPYSRDLIGKWLRRLADHDHGTAMIFARTETEAFHTHVWERSAGLLFLRGRISFRREDGSVAPGSGNAGAPSVLCAYGAEDLERLACCGLDGAFVPLRFPRFVVAAVLTGTWRDVILDAVRRHREPVRLADLYRALGRHPKAAGNPNWQAKVRQVLQHGPFVRVDRGVWSLDPTAQSAPT